ncbi:MAG: hypothetical protein B6D39_01635 [Anaerolineae bacterium UTCFX2]|jgi:transposase-like protein|nr:hypothetical protein [Anaerolineales bacterium]OQY94206.1 MAG: hypothetical protein B6D39_01635 [Anaerolineae bacterium UTCFX2]
MTGIVLCLNDVKIPREKQLVNCPRCGGKSVRRWGSDTRNIYDTRPINAVVFRFFCVDCNRTFRYYPQGIDRSQLTVRIRRLAALLWLMDLSTRDVEDIFDALGVSINRMTVWREGQKLIEELSQQKLLSLDRRYTIIRREAGGELVPNGLSLSLSLDSSTILMLGNMLAESREALIAWLKTVLADLEIEIRDLSEFDLEVHELVHLSQ